MYNESCFPIPNPFDPSYRSMASFQEHRDLLKSQWGIVCPSSCFCRNPTLDADKARAKAEWDFLRQFLNGDGSQPNGSGRSVSA